MILSSPDQKASIGWLPDTRFIDVSRFPGQNRDRPILPNGSNYKGMTVMRRMAPEDFITSIAVPFAHPHARNIQVTGVQQFPELSGEYRKISTLLNGGDSFDYHTAIVTMEYSENGMQFLEKMVCAIEDWGQPGGGVWNSRETWYARAEKPWFESYFPVFATTGHSIKFNREWLSREIHHRQKNSGNAVQFRGQIEVIIREITEHRVLINSEINNNMFLTFTRQEDHINPFTGETEPGTREWSYRWQNARGDVIYTNNPNYSPNADRNIKVKGYKASELRQR